MHLWATTYYFAFMLLFREAVFSFGGLLQTHVNIEWNELNSNEMVESRQIVVVQIEVSVRQRVAEPWSDHFDERAKIN